MSGQCDFCPRTGTLRRCVCVHEHIVGVWVCAEKHDDFLDGEIGCRVCHDSADPHFCTLHVIAGPTT